MKAGTFPEYEAGAIGASHEGLIAEGEHIVLHVTSPIRLSAKRKHGIQEKHNLWLPRKFGRSTRCA
jgi:hypothetical protein